MARYSENFRHESFSLKIKDGSFTKVMMIKDTQEFKATVKDIVFFMPNYFIGTLWNLVHEHKDSKEERRVLYRKHFLKQDIEDRYVVWKDEIIKYKHRHKQQKSQKRFPIFKRNTKLYAKSSLV